MTPAEIDAALQGTAREVKPILVGPSRHEERILAGAVALLAVIASEQEQRLRALESCPNHAGQHVWQGIRADGAPLADGEPWTLTTHEACRYCGCSRGNAP